jgi:hypothetical protein
MQSLNRQPAHFKDKMPLAELRNLQKIENPHQVHDKLGIFMSTVGFNRAKDIKPW